jgi:hypothetical protein
MLARTLRQVAASCLLTVAASLAVACIWRVQQTSKLPSDVVLAPKGEDWYESQVKLAKAGLIPSSEVPLEPEAERRRRRQRREHRERGRNNGRHNSDALGFLSVRADAVGQARRVRARLHDASSSQNAGSHSVARLLPGGRGLDALQHAERKWERSHEGHTQIAYSGIVPYLQRKSSRPRAVNCLGALSVMPHAKTSPDCAIFNMFHTTLASALLGLYCATAGAPTTLVCAQVSCIADATIKSLQGAPPPPSLGRKAVEQAAKGRGFAPWPTACVPPPITSSPFAPLRPTRARD